MGDFDIPEEKKTEEKKPELITDFEELRSSYKEFKFKIKEKTTNSHNMILPLMSELFTYDKNNKHIGLIDQLEREIIIKRWNKTTIGQQTEKIIDKINQYWLWSEDYSTYIEDCIDDFFRVADSSFLIIQNMQKKMIDLEIRNRELSEYAAAESKGKPEAPILDRKLELQKFSVELEKLNTEYKKALERGNPGEITQAKTAMRNLARGDPVKAKLICDLFDANKAIEAAKKGLTLD